MYKNYEGKYAGIADGGVQFSFLYEGPFTPVRQGSSFFSETFKIPRKINQVIKYIDADTGATLYTDESQVGISGQFFTTKQKPMEGYYVPELPKYTPGYLSPYEKGYRFTQYSNNYLYITYEQIDDAGNMNINAYDMYNRRSVFPTSTQSNPVPPDATGYSFWYNMNYEYKYAISNPYIPRTNEVVYRYKKVAKIVYTSNDSAFRKGSKPYTSKP